MNNRVIQREEQLFGAYVASADIRKEVSSDDFTVNRLREGAKEIEDFEAGKITRNQMVALPFLVESLQIPDGVKYIDGLISAVKSHALSKRAYQAAVLGMLAKNPQQVESFKQKVSEL